MIPVTPAEVLLHPVRMRIVRALLGDRALTTGQLGEHLPDVPTATLYRQVAALAAAGVLEVSGERPVRGAVERSYRLRTEAASAGPEDAATWTVEQHRAAFTAFVTGLLADFDRYLDRGDVDLSRDVVGYRSVGLFLTDEEALDLVAELGEVLARREGLPPEGRRRRLISRIILPAD